MEDKDYMLLALEEAKKASLENEVPVGAVLVVGDKIYSAHNEREKKNDISSHAEIEVIKKAEKDLNNWLLPTATLYVTLEPCLMCAGAIAQARIKRLVYATSDPSMGAITSHYYVYDDPTLGYHPLVNVGICQSESQSLLKKFFASKRN
jgi:tRNA(adenine34) deaminase